MQPIDFVYTNIRKELLDKGFDGETSCKCAETAVKMWLELDKSPKGPMYNFLLKEALKSAEGESNEK